MLGRRILRIKAFKLVYSIAENPAMTLKEALAQLTQSCESTRDLYLFLMSIVKPLTDEALGRIEAARGKFNPNEEEKNPNMKFVGNQVADLLGNDPDFQKIVSKKKLEWDQYDVFLRHLYDSVKSSSYFEKYMSSEERSLKEDAELFRTIFETELPYNKELEDILEDLSIWWNDDIVYAVNCCSKTFDELGRGVRWSMPELYLSEMSGDSSMESDRDFVFGIVRTAVRNFEKYYQDIADHTAKWNKDRICTTDLALIATGLAEHDSFSDMPSKVIINEYVEISKFYSTPESRAFVNGLLDKLINK